MLWYNHIDTWLWPIGQTSIYYDIVAQISFICISIAVNNDSGLFKASLQFTCLRLRCNSQSCPFFSDEFYFRHLYSSDVGDNRNTTHTCNWVIIGPDYGFSLVHAKLIYEQKDIDSKISRKCRPLSEYLNMITYLLDIRYSRLEYKYIVHVLWLQGMEQVEGTGLADGSREAIHEIYTTLYQLPNYPAGQCKADMIVHHFPWRYLLHWSHEY